MTVATNAQLELRHQPLCRKLADVVPRRRVALAGITKSDDQPVNRHGLARALEDAHGFKAG